MTHQQDVLNEIMRLSRFYYQPPPPWMYSSFASPPVRASAPPKPPTTPTTQIVHTPAYEAPVAPVEPATKFEAEVAPTWQALLDVTVWRSRPWWRLAASIVVRRKRLETS